MYLWPRRLARSRNRKRRMSQRSLKVVRTAELAPMFSHLTKSGPREFVQQAEHEVDETIGTEFHDINGRQRQRVMSTFQRVESSVC